MQLKKLSTWLLAASFMMAPAANAAGMILIDPVAGGPFRPIPINVAPVPIHPTPGRPTPPVVLKGGVSYGLRLQAAEVKVEITDQVAKTYITQTFANDTDRVLAGTYLFPLPEDTTFSSFSLQIDGKPVEGKILEANEARQQYEEIVRRMVDPGLLEYADYKTVRARIYPIPAKGTKKVELEYTQLLRAENGMLKYRFPLKTEGAIAADDIKVNVKLNSKQDLRTIWSPSHNISTTRDGDHTAKVKFEAADTIPDKDFYLYYSVSDKDVAANLLTNKSTDEDGYFLLTLTPPTQTKEVIAKDIVLVADTSGSMAGERMEENKKALKYLVNALGPDDRFSIVQFNTDIDSFKTTLVQATPENKKAAAAYVDDLEARGGTNIGDALKTGLTMLGEGDQKRPAYVVLMTDGEPTVGETTIPGLLKAFNSKRDVRLFDFGVGYDVNTRLLNRLAEEHHGTAQYVQPDENLETSLSDFYQKIKSPVLADVKIDYDGIQVKDMYPRQPKDMFAGSQLMLLGRYKGSGDGSVKITGTVNGVNKAYTFPLKFAAADTGHTYLPRLWAMRRIGHLTEVAKDNGDNREVVDEIISLSKKYGIISQYTSFLVTDPNEPNAHGMPVGGMRPMRTSSAGGGGRTHVSFGGGLPPTNMGRFVHQPGDNQYSVEATVRRHGSTGFVPAPPALSVSAPRAASNAVPMGSFVASSGYSADTFGDEGANTFIASNLKAESGKAAVTRERKLAALNKDVAIDADKGADVKNVEGKTFYLKDGVWVDSSYSESGTKKAKNILFGSKEYFDLLKQPGLSKFLAVGRQVVVVFNDEVYRITFKGDDPA